MYRIQAEDRQLRKVERICRRKRYEIRRTYPENLGRSDNYRREFLRANPRPAGGYRCRYCHRRLPERKMTIDHIYPIYLAKSGKSFWLKLAWLKDVNDVRNLAPACRRCNAKKGRKAGIWVLRGIVGKYAIYWWIRRGLRLALLAGMLYLVYRCHLVEKVCSLIMLCKT